MAMATLKSISAALELIDGKKANLRKAFEDLQAHSSSLSSFSAFNNLKWEDLDSYFTSIHSNLLHKFYLLQSIEPAQPRLQISKEKQKAKSAVTEPVPARLELKSFCEKMDGLGLRNYILDRPRERAAIRAEMADAWKYAPYPAKMAIDALEGFFTDGPASSRIEELGALRRACVVLLEEFMKAGVEIGVEVKERARALAAEWKGKLPVVSDGSDGAAAGDGEEEGLEKLGFLHLLAAFRLVDNGGFDLDELIEYAVVIAKYRQAVDLCRFIGLGDRIADVVQKLIGKGKQLLAVKFILQFGLTDKFPPVPLLKIYVSDSNKLAQKVRENGNSSRQALNEAAEKEISSLKSVIKIIEDHNLESEYPKDILLKCVEELEKEMTSRKRAAAALVVKDQQPLKQQKHSGKKNTRKQPLKKKKPSGNKNTQKHGAAGPSAIHKNVVAHTTVPPIRQSHVQTAGILADPYLSSPAAAYGLAGPTPAVATYASISSGMYRMSGTHTGFSGNVDPSVSNLYPPESQTRPNYHNSSLVYGGYDLPNQYHPAYYLQ